MSKNKDHCVSLHEAAQGSSVRRGKRTRSTRPIFHRGCFSADEKAALRPDLLIRTVLYHEFAGHRQRLRGRAWQDRFTE
jgi:hypothetical protein